jgi:hypothetical protein
MDVSLPGISHDVPLFVYIYLLIPTKNSFANQVASHPLNLEWESKKSVKGSSFMITTNASSYCYVFLCYWF